MASGGGKVGRPRERHLAVQESTNARQHAKGGAIGSE